ncbi:MAG: hypothetical protein QT05_C0011G0007 [archaeon GW2011_AR13]|nr:MAG: hypothetical protein QT05_C0011G0007 [archaeon GW2011_AR13]HIG94347.1 hypothetical protein [Nanoarchaeota archaeon]HIH63683.1 hypothetical protein [Nanoarchaeota archaeon]HIJ10062.1 hypothetical protein [Nanoarchaeota archaeon]
MAFEIVGKVIADNTQVIIDNPLTDIMIGGIIGGLIALGIITIIFLLISLYVYHSFSWMVIARKLKHKHPWLSWIPFASTALRLQLGGFHWAWVFLYLLPIVGWIALFVLLIISYWRVFEKRKYPGWFSLSMIIPKIGLVLYLTAIGFVAFKDRKKRLKL